MSKQTFIIGDEPLTLNAIWNWLENPAPIAIGKSVKAKMDASRKVVDNCLSDGLAHYGINTGFGNFANTRIPDDKLKQLQYNLVCSHAGGVGEPFSDEIVRLLALLRANVLAMGYSGVRYQLLEELVHFINKGKLPKIPSQGSVGASGDLAPLAHLALALIDSGVKLEAKEGLALINGIQCCLSIAAIAVRDAGRLLDIANMAAALSLEGLRGTDRAYDERIANVRCQEGHKLVAKKIRVLVNGSEIISSHKNCSRVQDPYSVRCVPQVHGAVMDTYIYVRKIIEAELSSCTDNPLIFDEDIISGGNFHGSTIGIACDNLATAITVLGNISERRIEHMLNPKQGELKTKGLVKDAGINSGLMVGHVTVSAIASENKTLSFPASADSITTFAGQEDFVSMAMGAVRKLTQIIRNTEKIIAVELLSAAQAIDLHEEKRKPGVGTKKIYDIIRKNVPYWESDRVLYHDIEKMIELVKNGLNV